MAMMRTRKDGGCSLCNASDENVGKRRCCHVLDNAAVAVRHEKGINYIDISGKVDGNDTEFSVKANQEKIKSFISTLSSGLSKKDQEGILSILREG
ncbi:MAG: hypothetical protein IJZ79_02705 [Bacilli bacterium]|nr:hypothetical protein [Bacilli bacterium]MBQ8218635.1 hypothetical protein [Bacilli bacterium]